MPSELLNSQQGKIPMHYFSAMATLSALGVFGVRCQ